LTKETDEQVINPLPGVLLAALSIGFAGDSIAFAMADPRAAKIGILVDAVFARTSVASLI
jgi:hypothetical protein